MTSTGLVPAIAGIKQTNLLVKKIIYAKRQPTTKEQIDSILSLEIYNHLRNNPGITFYGIGDVTDNADKSKTFNLIFKPLA